MTAIAYGRMTLEAFLRLRERKPALEFEDGEVTQKVSPKGRHSTLQEASSRSINEFAIPLQLARAFTELRTTFGGRSYVPDVAVFRWERVPTTTTGEVADDFLLPPDIAIEIVSPGQSVTRLRKRCRWYVEHGVRIALLIVPSKRLVYRFGHRGDDVLLTDDDRIDLDDVLPGFRLTVNGLFAALRMD
jgi:Uma2 family endonuclease